MSLIKVGRVCVKIAGRNAGKYCVITKKIDDSFVEISGPKKISGIKRNRCNISHLELTEQTVPIKAKSTDADIEKELKKAKLLERFKERINL